MQKSASFNTDVTPISQFQSLYKLLSPGPTLDFHDTSAHGRAEIEDYIASQFNAIYGAKIRHFMPLFLSMRCNRSPITAVGMRPAETTDLFLEQYLPDTIESFVCQVAGKPVSRNQIIEIGNLVATQRGGSQLLFLMLTAVLLPTRYEWVVFTATPQVHKTMSRMGMPLHDLYAADPALLTNSHISEWGTYYDSHPRVVSVNVEKVMRLLCQRKAYATVIACYQSQIDEIARQLNSLSNGHELHSLSA